MIRLAIANAVAHRGRLALTWLAVALGVAFVAGSLVLTDTSTRLLDAQFRTAAGQVDLTVRGAAAFDSAMGVEVARDPLPVDITDRIADTAGVGAVRPVVSGAARLVHEGRAVTASGTTMLGTWAEAPYTAYRLRDGRAPDGGDEVVLDVATARQQRIALGDVITVAAIGSRELRVVGLTTVGDDDGISGTTTVLTNLPTAQGLLGLGTGVTSVDVIADDSTAVTDLRSSLAERLGTSYAVTSMQDAAAASADAAKQSISFLRVVLLALAAAGLVVGAFLIANTFAIVLTQRSRELALLRAAGATGRQVLSSMLGEALLVGVTGAVSGTLLGIGAAYALRDVARTGGLALPDGALMVEPRTVFVSVGAGTVVTLLAALGPARRASRIAPVEAMRSSDGLPSPVRRRRWVIGSLLLALGAVQLLVASLSRDIAGVGLGAALLLLSVLVLGPALTPRLARVLGRPLDRGGVPGRLARESTVRHPRRTSATAMALALGLALVSFVAVLTDSVKASITSNYEEMILADLVVESSANEMLGGLSPEIATRVAGLREVAAVSSVRYGHWRDSGSTSALTAIDPATISDVARIRMTSGRIDELSKGGVVLSEKTAEAKDLRVGDTLSMTFARDGDQLLPVVGIVEDASARALSTSFLISLDTYREHFAENADASVFVAVRDGVGIAQAQTALEDALSDYPNADVRDQDEAVAGRAAAIAQVLGLITVLLLFAVAIALLGITNTLALSIVERTREIGLLRAVGMTVRQLRWMVRAEAALVAVLAVVVGVGVGLLLSVSTLTALSADQPVAVRVPVGQLLLIVAAAVVAGVVAGLLPSRRAARLDVLTAIATT